MTKKIKNAAASQNPPWFDDRGWRWRHVFNPQRTILSLVADDGSSSPAAQIKLSPKDDADHWHMRICRKQREVMSTDLDITTLDFLFGLTTDPRRVKLLTDREGAMRLDAEYFLPGYGAKTDGFLALIPDREARVSTVAQHAVQLRLTPSVSDPIRTFRTLVMEQA